AYEEERRRAEALAEIDRAKTTFFSNVSHEFRTPLTLMLSPLEELLSGGEGHLLPAQRSLAEIAHRNGQRLLKLVNTLLDFARIEAGRATASF
ncbi:sensor histidine kinase, partial [Ralstonia solanacearum]